MQRQTHPVHFEDFSGQQFERLCLAYFVRRYPGAVVSWYGQLGGDRGRDIVCEPPGEPTRVIQCANFQRFAFKKVDEDLRKLASGPRSAGAMFHLVCGGAVSSDMRGKIERKARSCGFDASAVWSGAEFEENIRVTAPDVLRRFTAGEQFPELPEEVAAFASSSAAASDREIADGLVLVLDRPAFKTHFHQESSLPRFKVAIAEAIETLNTGRTPQGAQLSSRHQIREPSLAKVFDEIVRLLVGLRAAFDNFIRTGEIRPCGCGQPECPVFFFEHAAAEDMDARRRTILTLGRHASERFQPDFY